jgi:predicted secreted protein
MIDEEGLYIWIWPWILAQLVLPVETMTQWDKHEVSPPFRNKKRKPANKK